MQPANIAGSFLGGAQGGARIADFQRQGEVRNYLAENMGPVMAGDQNALAGLAALDPGAAMGIYGDVQNRALQREQFDYRRSRDQAADARADEALRLKAAEFAAGLSAQERAEQARRIEQGLSQGVMLYQRGDLDGLNQMVTGFGLPPLQSLEEFPTLAARYETVYDTLTRAEEFGAEPEVPAAVRTLQARAQAAGLAPGSEEYREFMRQGGTQPPVTNVTVGGEDTDALQQVLGKKQGEMFAAMIDTGMQAGQNLAQINEIERILGQSDTPEGAEAALKLAAGNLGIQTEGLSDLQAAQALINRMVPAQRQPGSGPMSDADLALFKQSLPRLINSREGNQQIVRMLRGISEYTIRQGQIAGAVANGQLTAEQARAALMELENPLQMLRDGDGPVSIGQGGLSPEVESLLEKYGQ